MARLTIVDHDLDAAADLYHRLKNRLAVLDDGGSWAAWRREDDFAVDDAGAFDAETRWCLKAEGGAIPLRFTGRPGKNERRPTFYEFLTGYRLTPIAVGKLLSGVNP